MIEIVNLRQPKRITFGAGSLAECPAELLHLGSKRPLVICSRSVLPQIEAMLASCREKGLTPSLLTGVPAEPTVADCEALRVKAADAQADAVLAIGGGSVLDVAKLVCALLGRSEKVSPFFGNGLLPERRFPLVCVPTTAGAGSEVSPNAILYDEAESLKKAVISPWLVPDAAIVDPALHLSLPPEITAATGIDALTHCLEAVLNRFSHPCVDLYALEGIRLISTSIETVVREGKNLEARSAIARGSLYGGLCLGPVNTAAVHALSYPLGSRFRLAHGLSNALLLPHVFRFNVPAATASCARVALALGVHPGHDELSTALAGADRLAALNKACGVPSGLAQLGIKESDLPGMAEDAMKITRLLRNNPREVSLRDALHIYKSAF